MGSKRRQRRRNQWHSPSYRFRTPGGSAKRRRERYRLAGEQNWRCAYCRCALDFANVTIDHVIPLSVGRDNSWFNKVAACFGCNRRKRDMTGEAFLAVLALDSSGGLECRAG